MLRKSSRMGAGRPFGDLLIVTARQPSVAGNGFGRAERAKSAKSLPGVLPPEIKPAEITNSSYRGHSCER
jgi:hypothetical protein